MPRHFGLRAAPKAARSAVVGSSSALQDRASVSTSKSPSGTIIGRRQSAYPSLPSACTASLCELARLPWPSIRRGKLDGRPS